MTWLYWLKRLLGLTPWAAMHRKAFLMGFEEGMKAGSQATVVLLRSGVSTGDVNDYLGRENRTIN